MFPQKEPISWNIDQVGYADLDGKAGFKMAIHRVGERWYLYSALLWEPGFVILDITDPYKHRYIADSDDRAHVFRSDAAQRSDLIARSWST
jgi:hypothetical protein